MDNKLLYQEYVFSKQTLSQLATKYKVSSRTIQRHLSQVHSERIILKDKSVIVLMDTTYWGWRFGVVVFKDAATGKILWRKYIHRKETLLDYTQGISWLLANNFRIRGIVCDGLRGLFKQFSIYKVQVCQYHQIAIVRRYLTRRPELPAGISLLQLVKTLPGSNKEDFIKHFNAWELEWDACIKERKKDRHTGKSYYVHKKLRSAYLSLKRNMNWYLHLNKNR